MEYVFAERLAVMLELRDMTQGQLAVKSGISQPHISRILRGENVPNVDIAAQLAAALNVSLDWLVGLPERQPDALRPEEDQLLRIFRRISDERGRRIALRVLAGLLLEEEYEDPND